jgi:hypothetical protein
LTYQTELTAYIADLIGFMLDKIDEAEADPGSRPASLSEAAGALPVIRARLLREDQTIHAQFMLLGLFDMDFGATAALPPDAFAPAIDDLRGRLKTVRSYLKPA